MPVNFGSLEEFHRAQIIGGSFGWISVAAGAGPDPEGQPNLLQIIDAIDSLLFGLLLRERRNKNGHQKNHCCNGSDEFDESECRPAVFLGRSHGSLIRFVANGEF